MRIRFWKWKIFRSSGMVFTFLAGISCGALLIVRGPWDFLVMVLFALVIFLVLWGLRLVYTQNQLEGRIFDGKDGNIENTVSVALDAIMHIARGDDTAARVSVRDFIVSLVKLYMVVVSRRWIFAGIVGLLAAVGGLWGYEQIREQNRELQNQNALLSQQIQSVKEQSLSTSFRQLLAAYDDPQMTWAKALLKATHEEITASIRNDEVGDSEAPCIIYDIFNVNNNECASEEGGPEQTSGKSAQNSISKAIRLKRYYESLIEMKKRDPGADTDYSICRFYNYFYEPPEAGTNLERIIECDHSLYYRPRERAGILNENLEVDKARRLVKNYFEQVMIFSKRGDIDSAWLKERFSEYTPDFLLRNWLPLELGQNVSRFDQNEDLNSLKASNQKAIEVIEYLDKILNPDFQEWELDTSISSIGAIATKPNESRVFYLVPDDGGSSACGSSSEICIIELDMYGFTPRVNRSIEIPLCSRAIKCDIEGIAVDAQGNFWLADEGESDIENRIIKLKSTGEVERVINIPSERLRNTEGKSWPGTNGYGFEGIALVEHEEKISLYVAVQRVDEGQCSGDLGAAILRFEIDQHNQVKQDIALCYKADDPFQIIEQARTELLKRSWFGESIARWWYNDIQMGISEVALDPQADLLWILERDNQSGEKALVKRVYPIQYTQNASHHNQSKIVPGLDLLREYRIDSEKPEGMVFTEEGLWLITDNDRGEAPTKLYFIRRSQDSPLSVDPTPTSSTANPPAPTTPPAHTPGTHPYPAPQKDPPPSHTPPPPAPPP